MIEVLGRAATLVAIIALGYAAKRIGWVQASDFSVLSRIVLRITLPCALITSFNTFTITPGLLFLSALGAAVVLAHQVAGYVADAAGGRRAQAFGVLNVGSFNIGLFALPYVGAFLGPEGIVYAALFDLGAALMAAGFGYSWAMTLAGGEPASARRLVRQVFGSFVSDTYLVLLALGLLQIKLPEAVIGFTSTVGASNTFLAMFMIGVGLQIGLTRRKYAEALKHLALRYGVALAALPLVWFALPVDETARLVVCLLLFAPIATMISGFTAEAGLDVEVSVFTTSVTVLIGIVAMPVLLLVLGG